MISLSGGEKKRVESELIAARTAEKLLRVRYSLSLSLTSVTILQEIRPLTPANSLKVKVLESYILLVGQSRQNAEKVLVRLNEIGQHDVRECVTFSICVLF